MYFGQSTSDTTTIIAELNAQYLALTLMKMANQSTTFDSLSSPCQWKYSDVFCSEDYLPWVKEWTTLLQNSNESLDKSARFCNNNVTYVTSMTSEWCSKCWQSNEQDCIALGQLPFYQRKYLQQYLRQICTFTRSNFETIQLYDLYMRHYSVANWDQNAGLIEMNMLVQEATGVDALNLWFKLNSQFLPLNFDERLNISDSELQGDLSKILESFEAPKIHGNFERELVLIPLCNYGSQDLVPCTLFKKTKSFYSNGNVCYTFNFDGAIKGKSISLDKGLNFVVNLRLPGDFGLKPPIIVVHPNGLQPDLNIFPASTLRIEPAKYMRVGIQANIYKVTKGFLDLGTEVTKCHFEPNYSEINCEMKQSIKEAITACNCTPWFLESFETTVCTDEKLKCFDDYSRNQTFDNKCLKSCVYSEYSVNSKVDNLQIKGVFDTIQESYGNIFRSYVSENNPMLFADEWSWNTYENVMAKSALINVNFEKKYATVITKDAKVSFADMLGTIGGTFGVFLGLSFVGILDFIILIFDFFKK